MTQEVITATFQGALIESCKFEYTDAGNHLLHRGDSLMSANGLDGVMYPSVPSNGRYGMNIALCKEIADSKLILEGVNEME